ncbi:MAG: hypothetical protein N3J91_06955 [Verrucomicrobiae bacterium]|nr:hypothetical protein [Verrucomicrobiae bacterium]
MNEITSVNIAGWLACAAFLIWMVNGVLGLVDRFKPRPSTEEVRLEAAKNFVTQEQFEHREQMASDSRKTMYAKIDSIRMELSQEIRAVNARVDELSAEVRAVPATVVRLISEARKM